MLMGNTIRLILAAIVLINVLGMEGRAIAQEEFDEELRTGLVATYASIDRPQETATRIDRDVAFEWAGSPDPRLGPGPFTAVWRGFLLTPGSGAYRLAAHGTGEVTITLAGKRVLQASADSPAWMDASPAEFSFGWQPLEVRYVSRGESSRLTVFWSGPQFAWEPISERQFFYAPQEAPSDRFSRGEELVAALRCHACHGAELKIAAPPAPALDRLEGNLSHDWLVESLTSIDAASDSSRRMPHFGLSQSEAKAVAAYLIAASEPAPRETAPESREAGSQRAAQPKKSGGKENPKQEKPSAAAGERLLLTVGCLACHRVGEFGESDLFGGGDLSRIAEKRPADFFTRWLTNPAAVNRDHHMPIFELTARERESLSLYLATLGDRKAERPTAVREEELIRQGRRLVESNRCGACHALPKDSARPAFASALSEISNWDRACSGDPHPGKQPGYRLSAEDTAAVREYVAATSGVAHRDSAAADSRIVLRRRNCLACHEREGSPGLAPKLAPVIAAREDLAPLLPSMTPPPLVSVGDKLRDEALADAIRRAGPPHRPYLAARMPKFHLPDNELHALVRRFIVQDRIPLRTDATSTHVEPDPAVEAAGPRLVTSDGFGCVSCHQIGSVQPDKAPLNARGPDLSLLENRIRREWFDRWVRNPARIVPRMEMPAVQLPVRGVLKDNLDEQLAAVWRALNTPGFEPPPPNPVRVLRRSGMNDRNEWAAVGTDVLEDRGRQYLKPLLIGLPNRHNVLLDLEQNRLAGWWLGDAARQRTRGKSWYWEAGGTPYEHLFAEPVEGSELALELAGRRREPLVVGQFPTEIDQWRHSGDGVAWRQRLRFSTDDDAGRATVHVEQTIVPVWPSAGAAENGFRRTIAIRGAPKLAKIVFRSVAGRSGNDVRIRLSAPREASLDEQGVITLASSGPQETVTLELEYLTTRQPDAFPTEPPAPPPPSPVSLSVAPGFEAVQLPLPEVLMPTALAWTPQGAMAIASLKGEVWLARDTDGDGLEDDAQPFSDDLAAPYGLAAGENYLDVINKYALLRLYDEDGDGRAERTVTLASGWGHTADYHDWAVGLPRDDEGAYYVALPCQQDERSAAAAHLRGTLLRLVPRQPNENDPRRFALEQVTAGHRFPMGVARRRDGELFVTDNQGNYNPFNELNHIVPGSRYGFINKLEQRPGFNPPFLAPAIDLPHPWTRSVNGICFLDTPAPLRQKLGRDAFGPFEGHLVGCEMNNRALVRMTLQRVGDVMQGAAYPMSYPAPEGGPSLLGPLCAEVSPAGDLYVGSLLDSGWGGGNNIGTIVRMRPIPENLPAGIREVRASPQGLVVEFTRPVDSQRASDRGNYSLTSYTRISTPAYGGDDVDRRMEEIIGISATPDGLSATLRLKEWRENFVYELHLKNLAGAGQEFFPAEAYYTLRRTPR
jgi:mono/diheme cytochrome c family protein